MADPNYIDMFINAYTAGYADVPQEKRNPFAGAVETVPLTGEYLSFDDIGVSAGKEKTTRFAKHTHGDNTFRRRWLYPRWFYPDPILVDKQDNIGLHTDPSGAFMRNMLYWTERKKRDVVIESFDATVTGGKNPGDTSYSFTNTTIDNATGRTIPHDSDLEGDAGGTSTGLTSDKIVLMQEKFASYDVPDGTKLYLACNYRQLSDLRREAELQGTDTSDIKALMERRIRSLMGVEFIVTNGITLGSSNDIDSDTNVYECWAWVEGAISFAPHLAPTFAVDRMPDYVGDVWQIKADFGCNAIRRHEDLVIKIECASIAS